MDIRKKLLKTSLITLDRLFSKIIPLNMKHLFLKNNEMKLRLFVKDGFDANVLLNISSLAYSMGFTINVLQWNSTLLKR
jgi:hypothetical protein